jgi:hypothetical protein
MGYGEFPGKIRELPTSPDQKTVVRYGAPGFVEEERLYNLSSHTTL